MKRNLEIVCAFLVINAFVQNIAFAQNTTYLSNLTGGQLGTVPVASNSLLAQSFKTGTNSFGYSLGTIGLSLGLASGTPSSFTVSIHSDNDFQPGISLWQLNGATNPLSGGIFSYSLSDTLLAPSTKYWIVISAQTALSTGAYYSRTESFFNLTKVGNWSTDRYYSKSVDGISWTDSNVGFNLQFSVSATAVPEPTTLSLLGLSAGLLVLAHKKRRAIQR